MYKVHVRVQEVRDEIVTNWTFYVILIYIYLLTTDIKIDLL